MTTVSEPAPLCIGPRRLPTRWCLAPLAGYTQLPFRLAMRELGGIGLCTTDLIHAGHLLGGSRKSAELIATTEEDRPLSVQIFGKDRREITEAARWLEDRGFAGIDLNMGCPMGKINSAGGGARLLCDAAGAAGLVADVVRAVTVPVTVKMRLGWDRTSLTAPLLAAQFEEAGAAAITVHGRTRSQGFGGSVDREGIAATVAAVRNIPVLANGDVRTVEDASDMLRITGCAGIAIGRGAMLDPWLFRKLTQWEAGRPVTEPTAAEQIDFLRRHFELMCSLHGDRACVLFRKFAGWYGAKLGIPESLEDRLRRLELPDEFDDLLAEIRSRHGERATSIPTALLKVPNGPVEHW